MTAIAEFFSVIESLLSVPDSFYNNKAKQSE